MRVVSDSDPLPPEEVANWEDVLASKGFPVNPKSLKYLLKLLDAAERKDSLGKLAAAQDEIEDFGIGLDSKDMPNFCYELKQAAKANTELNGTIKDIIAVVKGVRKGLGKDKLPAMAPKAVAKTHLSSLLLPPPKAFLKNTPLRLDLRRGIIVRRA
jgi:hypothetical protein